MGVQPKIYVILNRQVENARLSSFHLIGMQRVNGRILKTVVEANDRSLAALMESNHIVITVL